MPMTSPTPPASVPSEEDVARAIYNDRNGYDGYGRKPWSNLPMSHKEPYLADARAILALFAPVLAEKERVRAREVDGSIDIRLDDKGGIDEIFGNGVLCHIERMDKGHWFISMIRPDQTSEAFWLNGKGKVEFTLHEHRPAPSMEMRWEFEVELEGEDAYVIERKGGEKGHIKWGPMPRDMAGPFIDERKESLAALAKRILGDIRAHYASPGNREE